MIYVDRDLSGAAYVQHIIPENIGSTADKLLYLVDRYLSRYGLCTTSPSGKIQGPDSEGRDRSVRYGLRTTSRNGECVTVFDRGSTFPQKMVSE